MAEEKSSSGAYHGLSLFLQAIQTAAFIGILVVLAILLVELKKIADEVSNPTFNFPIAVPDGIAVRLPNSGGANSFSPFFVQTVT
jgi:hypothetical protein